MLKYHFTLIWNASSLPVAQNILITPSLLQQNWAHYLKLFLAASRFDLIMMVFKYKNYFLMHSTWEKKSSKHKCLFVFLISSFCFVRNWPRKSKLMQQIVLNGSLIDWYGVMVRLTASDSFLFCILCPLLPCSLSFILQLLSKI